MKGQRFHLVESLRTIAALLVGLYHLLLFSVNGQDLFPEMDASQLFFEFLKTTVLAFFIITAIVMPVHFEQEQYTIRDYLVFLFKRLLRVHVPFLAVICLIVLVEQFFLLRSGEQVHIDWFRFFANISLTAEFSHVPWYNTIFWTLAIEMQFYILIGLVYPLIRKWPLWGTLGFFLAGELLHLLSNDTRFVWYYTPYFTSGLIVYFLLIGKLTKLQMTLITMIIAAIVWFLHGRFEMPVVFIVPLLFLIVPNTANVFGYFGRFTFSFYLIHGLSGGLLLYFTRNMDAGTGWGILRLILALVVSFTATWLFYRCVEKPATKLTHRLRYRAR